MLIYFLFFLSLSTAQDEFFSIDFQSSTQSSQGHFSGLISEDRFSYSLVVPVSGFDVLLVSFHQGRCDGLLINVSEVSNLWEGDIFKQLGHAILDQSTINNFKSGKVHLSVILTSGEMADYLCLPLNKIIKEYRQIY